MLIFETANNRKNLFFLYSILGIILTLPYNLLANNIFIALLIISWLSSGNWDKKIDNLRHNKLFYLFSSLFIINIIGLAYTNYFDSGLAFIERRLTIFVFPLVLLSSKHILTSYNVRALLVAFSLVMVGGSLFSHINIFTELINKNQPILAIFGSPYTHTGLSQYTNFHAGYFSMYNSFAVFILLYYSYLANSMVRKAVGFLLSFYLLFFNLMLASRIGLIAMILIIVFLALYYIITTKKTKLILWLVFFIITIPLIIGIFSPSIKKRLYENPKEVLTMDAYTITTKNFQRLGSILFRIQIYDCSFSLLKYPNFIWGYGTGGSDGALQKCYAQKEYGWVAARKFNSHNQYLDQLLQHGLLGVIIFVWVIMYPLKRAFIAKEWLYAVFLMLISISALTENILNVQKGVVFYSIFNAILASKYSNDEKNPF